jgi:DNA mismatch repair ATPase MutS
MAVDKISLDGSMTVGANSLIALEVLQNARNKSSKACLLGVLNFTHTLMGGWFVCVTPLM